MMDEKTGTIFLYFHGEMIQRVRIGGPVDSARVQEQWKKKYGEMYFDKDVKVVEEKDATTKEVKKVKKNVPDYGKMNKKIQTGQKRLGNK